MADNQFKIRVGTEFDASGLDAQIKKHLKDQKIKINVDADTKSVIRKLQSTYKQMNSLKRQQLKLNIDSSEYKALDTEINRLIQRAVTLQSRLSGNLPNNIFDDIVEDSTRAEAAIKRVEASIADTRKQQAKNITKQINNGEFTRSFKEIEASIGNLRDPSLLAGSLTRLKEAYQALQNIGPIVDEESFNRAKIAVDRYNDALEATKTRYKIIEDKNRQLQRQMKRQNDADALSQKKTNFGLQIDNWLDNNSAAAAQFGDRLRDIQNRISDCNDAASFNKLKGEFTQVTLEAKNAGVAMMSFGDRLKRQFREYSSYVGIAGAFAAGIQSVRAMAQNVLEVDTAMTGLYRVTDMTAEQYDKLYADMISASKEYGTTLTDTINATSDWVRAGFDANTALGLADITAMYQHISDLDYDEASENLLTAYNGFKESFNEEFGGDVIKSVGHIADAFNELDNQYSITSAGLGEGLARSASALQLAGNTFEEAAALVGATSEVTQNPEKAGNAMKVLSLRLRGMKGELEELGEESEGVENISKMQGQILNMTKGKVNIFDDLGNFRSTYDIMKDIAEVYDELSSTDQAKLLETIAGKDRANDVAALLSNFDTAINMVETAENSAGSAAQENAKYLDSLQGRIDVMTASLQALSISALDSGFLKGGVSAITSLISGLTSLIDTVGLLPAAIGAATVAFSMFGKGVAYIDGSNKKLKIFGKTLEEIKSIAGSISSSGSIAGFITSLGNDKNPLAQLDKRMERDKAAINQFKEMMASGKHTYQDAFDQSFAGASASVKEWAKDIEVAKMSADDYEQSARKVAIANLAQQNSFKAGLVVLDDYNKKSEEQRRTMAQSAEVANTNVGNYMASLNGANATLGGFIKATVKSKAAQLAMNAAVGLGAGALMTLGSMALDFVIGKLMDFINRADNVKKAVEETTSAFETQRTELSKNKGSFDDAVESYEKLASGVDQITGKNLSLSSDEYEEYANAVNTIADMTPSLVAGYDAQGNAILTTKGNVEQLTDAYNDLIIAENNKLLNGDGEDYKGISDISEDLKNDLNSLESDMSVINNLEKLLSTGNITKDTILADFGTTVMRDASKVRDAMKAANKEVEGVDMTGLFGTAWANKDEAAEYLEAVTKQYPEVMRSMVNDFESNLDTATQEMRTAMGAHMENAFLLGDYANLDESAQSIATTIVNGIDSATIAELNRTGGDEAVIGYVDNILGALDGMGADKLEQFKSAFDLSGMFQSGDISLGEYRKQLDEVVQMIDELGLDPQVADALKLSLNVDDVQKQYDELLNHLTSKNIGEEAARNLIDGLNSTEMSVALDLIASGEIDVENLNADQIKQKIQEAADLQEAISFNLDITAETEGLDALNTAIQESNGAMGLTAESIDKVKSRYADLEGYDPAALFEKTTTGVRLNEEALNALEEQYIATNKAAQDQKIDALVKQYADLKKAKDEAAAAGDTDAVTNYENQMSALEDEIHNAQMVKAAYEGMTSAYNEWLNAKSGGQQGDMYNSILEGRESAIELANEGKWGNTELQEFIKMFSAEGALDNATPQEFADAWGVAIQRSNRYFQEGTQGIDNFLSDIAAKNSELVKMNEDGAWEIQPGVEIEDLAKEAEMANSTVEAILGQANEYGANFKIGIDEKSVDELVAEAEAATQKVNDALKESLGEDFEIETDVNVESVDEATSKLDTLQQQREAINNSDATVEVKEQGIEAVNASIRAIIAQKIQLEQPAFMSIDTSQVDASMADALAKAQEMQTAINELNNLTLQQSYGIEIDQSQLDTASQKVQEIAQQIADNGDLKMSLGFDENASVDDIKAKFETNEVTIPTKADTSQAESDINSLGENQTIDVTVNLSGDDKIAALESKMNAIDNKTIDANVSLTNDNSIAALESKMNAIDNKVIDASVSLTGAEQIAALESKMNAIDNKTIDATVSVYNAEAITSLQNAVSSIQSKSINVSVVVSNTPAVTALKAAVDALSAKTVDVTANVTGTAEVNGLTAAINRLTGKEINVSANVSGISAVNALANSISRVQSKTVNIKTNYTSSGKAPMVNGTAHVNGTVNGGRAYSKGDWGAKEDGTALMGELGPELIVRGDKWFTVGDNGAGFYQYKKNDIIFNHKQTEELFKNGYITSSGGRGRALAQGTAFASVSGGWKPGGIGGRPSGGGSSSSSKKNTSSKSSSKSSTKAATKAAQEAADEFEETFDWIEIAIDRIERAIENLSRTASSTFKTWTERTKALNSQIAETRNEIDLQQQAYNRYLQQANSVGLSSDWASKVQSGAIDISTITDEDLANKIKEYQEWYEKALDARDAIEELREAESELYNQRFENVSTKYDGILGVIQHEQAMLEESISQSEAKGYVTSTKYYDALIKNQQQQTAQLKKQREEMLKELQSGMASGAIKKNSETW